MLSRPSSSAPGSGTCLAIAVAVALLIVLYPVFDYDLYWHLAYGREMFSRGHVLTEDVFSYTAAGTHFNNRYWLSQLIFFRLWDSWGSSGLLLLKLLITAAIALLLFHSARNLGATPATAALTTVLAVMVGFYRFIERPEIFSLLFFALLGFILIGHQERKIDRRWLYAIPPLMLFWDWFHGGVYGLALLLTYVGVANLRHRRGDAEERREVRRLNWTAAATLLLMAADPLGLPSYGEYLEHVNGLYSRSSIMEYQPASWREFKPFFLMIAWAALLTLMRLRARLVAQGLVALAFGIMAWNISRAVGIFALACAPYLAGLLTPASGERLWIVRFARWSAVAVAALLAANVAWVKFYADAPQRLGWSLDDQFLPAGGVRFIKDVGLTGRLYNSGNIGGYLALHLYPFDKVFQYNHGAFFGDTARFVNSPQELERWNLTHAIVSNPEELTRLFPNTAWARVYRDPGTVLVVRRTPQNQALIDRYELRHFHPMLPDNDFLRLAANAATRHRLAFEMATYLAYRNDDRIARVFREIEQTYPDVRDDPELQAKRPGIAFYAGLRTNLRR